MDVCRRITEPLCCPAETISTLYINSTWIKLSNGKKTHTHKPTNSPMTHTTVTVTFGCCYLRSPGRAFLDLSNLLPHLSSPHTISSELGCTLLHGGSFKNENQNYHISCSPILGIYPEKTKIQKDPGTCVFIAARFTIAKT